MKHNCSPDKSTLDATASLFSFMNALVAGLIIKEKESLILSLYQNKDEPLRKFNLCGGS